MQTVEELQKEIIELKKKLNVLKWYEHPKNNIGYHTCLEPFENISISEYPSMGTTKEWADQWDVIINVSCSEDITHEPSRPDQRIYWIPTNEMGQWPYSNFVQFFSIMDYHYKKKSKILVHCAAGAYRSPTMVMQWLKYMGQQPIRAYEISRGRELSDDQLTFGSLEFRLIKPYRDGNLPPDFDVFISRLENNKDKEGYDSFTNAFFSPVWINREKQVNSVSKRNFLYSIRSYKYEIKDYFSKIKKLYTEGLKKYQVSRGYYSYYMDFRKVSIKKQEKYISSQVNWLKHYRERAKRESGLP